MECAAPLASGCPNCGFVNLPGAKFCSECATPLRSVAPVSAPEAVAERRLVSILFADLVGFTPFAEQRDSEEVRDTLTRYFDLAREVIGRYGGNVEKFHSDNSFYFGVQSAYSYNTLEDFYADANGYLGAKAAHTA